MMHIRRKQMATAVLSLAVLLLVAPVPARPQVSSGDAVPNVPKVWWITDNWGEPLGMTIDQGGNKFSGQLVLKDLVQAPAGRRASSQVFFFTCNAEDDAPLGAFDLYRVNLCEKVDCHITYRNCEGELAVWPHVINRKVMEQKLTIRGKVNPAWVDMEFVRKNGNLLAIPDGRSSTGIPLLELKMPNVDPRPVAF